MEVSVVDVALQLIWNEHVDAEISARLDGIFGLPAPGTASPRTQATTAAAVLADLVRELGGPSDLNQICEWCRGHIREAEIRQLLRESGNRRQRYEDAAAAVIANGEYPSALHVRTQLEGLEGQPWEIQLELHRRGYDERPSAEEKRWLGEYLQALGWTSGPGRWRAPRQSA